VSIRLHIDRIVLEGLDLPPAEARRFDPILRAELARLLAEPGAGGPAWRGSAAPAAAATVCVDQPARAAAVAAAIAGAIVGRLRP
jgi:hypothetical protein